MRYKQFGKKFYVISVILLICIIIFLIVLYLYKKTNESFEDNLTGIENKEQNKEYLLKRRFFSIGKNLANFNCIIPNSPLTCVYIKSFEIDNTQNDFFYVKYRGKTYKTDETKFLYSRDTIFYFPLVNIKFPFLNIKENTYAYLNPILTIKMLYMLEKVDFRPRISDALREIKHQLKYKRRGWSDVDKSPHLIGLAFDISRYTGIERKMFENNCDKLSLNFLAHGGRRNMHIHIQDDKIWTKKHIAKNVLNISEELIKEYYLKESMFNIYASHNSSLPNNFSDTINNFVSKNIYIYNYKSNSSNIAKIEIFNILGNKILEIYTLLNNSENNKFILDFSFLPSGIYNMKIYEGKHLSKEELLKIY